MQLWGAAASRHGSQNQLKSTTISSAASTFLCKVSFQDVRTTPSLDMTGHRTQADFRERSNAKQKLGTYLPGDAL